jgi:rSAM/selenodomain-associated transferase 2
MGLPLSVVIPTLNAASSLAATLQALDGACAEIVIADGGSTDATVAIARQNGAIVIHANRGRGSQMAAAVARASGRWLLLLHADTRLAAGWIEAARGHIADPTRAGYFRFALASSDLRARRLERLVAWRCRVVALPYGDQGLLISRELLDAIGGVRPLPLMEDVDLVRRLGRARLVALNVDAITAAARWEREGWLARSARNLLCLGLYFLGVPPQWIAALYG